MILKKTFKLENVFMRKAMTVQHTKAGASITFKYFQFYSYLIAASYIDLLLLWFVFDVTTIKS